MVEKTDQKSNQDLDEYRILYYYARIETETNYSLYINEARQKEEITLLNEALQRYYINKTFNSWSKDFEPYMKLVSDILKEVKKDKAKIYPANHLLFRAFEECDKRYVRMVIVGQDPYHDGSATGLAFDCKKKRPSLTNLLKELKDNTGVDIDSIEHWPKCNILLLNTAFTVKANEPGSHLEIWKPFTEIVFRVISEMDYPIIWLLLGKKAENYESLITNKNHYIIKAPHPSPLSRSFPGCKVFNEIDKVCDVIGHGRIHFDKIR
jgi:uracil-DNA glycosylase